jgi:hypothetical protein
LKKVKKKRFRNNFQNWFQFQLKSNQAMPIEDIEKIVTEPRLYLNKGRLTEGKERLSTVKLLVVTSLNLLILHKVKFIGDHLKVNLGHLWIAFSAFLALSRWTKE